MSVVEPMVGRPPQGAFLGCRCPKPAQCELKSPAGFIAAVRKIAVVTSRYGEHAKPIHDQTNGRGCRLEIDSAYRGHFKCPCGGIQFHYKIGIAAGPVKPSRTPDKSDGP